MIPVLTWNVEREIVEFGPLSLRWYSLLFAGGIVLGYVMVQRMFRKEGKPETLLDPLLVHVVIGTILGARLAHCLFYDPGYYISNPIKIFMIWEGGLASHGGFLGVIIGLMIFAKRYREVSFFYLTDRLAIPAMLCAAMIRIGNLFNSEIIGRPADVPWAVVFEKVDQIPRHPAQIYEAIGYFCIFLILYGFYRFKDRIVLEGRLFGIALTVSFTFRFLIEFVKEDQEAFQTTIINMGQILSLPFVAFGLFLISGAHRHIAFFQRGMSSGRQTALSADGPPKKMAKSANGPTGTHISSTAKKRNGGKRKGGKRRKS